jgi:hypothetical protein
MPHTQVFSQHQIPFASINSGGDNQFNSSYSVTGNAGQTVFSSAANSIYRMQHGFWQLYYQNVVQNVKEDNLSPTVFELEQNYPNPFNPSTIIKFATPERANVIIKIYDILGGEITTLINQEMDIGWYEIKFNADNYSSGIFIYRMHAGKYVSTKKMLMVK